MASLVDSQLGSHMVLQRAPARANIWGSTREKATVTVQFNQQQLTTQADDQGNWILALPKTPAGGPFSITVSSAGQSTTLTDVLFGDVYLCSGQSNMQFSVNQVFNATIEKAVANNYANAVRVTSWGLLAKFQEWAPASSNTVGYADWGPISAVCWFMGKEIYDRSKIPIGLVARSISNSPIQSWIDPSSISLCPGQYNDTNSNSGGNYNMMIKPLEKMQFKAAVWYQGENNVGHPQFYQCALSNMIKYWREHLKQTNLPFYLVQLAGYPSNGDGHLPALRLVYTSVAQQIPSVHVVTAFDTSDLSSPYWAIHPRTKKEVGHRLAVAISGKQYGKANAPIFGPIVTKTSVNGSSIILSFDRNDTVLLPQKQCPTSANICGNIFELLVNNVWKTATYTQIGTHMVVSVSSGAPTSIRYGWGDVPQAVVYGANGIPMRPFLRTL